MHNRINLFLIAFILAGTSVIYYGQQVTASPQQGTIPTATDTPIVNDSTVTPTSTGTPTSTPTPTATVHGDATPTRDLSWETPTAIPAQPTATPLATIVTSRRCDGSPWQFTSNMTTARSGHTATVMGDYLFVLGGAYAGIERAKINQDGTLAMWQRLGEIPSDRAYAASVTQGNYIYLLGGQNGRFVYRNVERVQVNADGSLGSWTEMEPMTTKRAWLAAVTVNDYIYAIGGVSEPGPGALTTVERTKINDDGTLSPWETVSPLVMSRFNHTAVLVGPYIYVIGGIGSGDIKTIQRAQIYADGTLSDWKATSSITDERQEGMSIAHQGYVYSFAGFTTTGAHNQFVERAKYDTEGNLGKWEQVNPFYYSRSAGAAVVKGDYLYVIGGSRLQNDTIVAQSVEWVNLSTLDLPFENGISINNGALYTNQTGVTLNISGQPGATLMQVSNDGGFAGATWEPCVREKPWTITQFGNSIIPRVVYSRFRDEAGNTSGVVQDDIILDVTAPSGSVAVVPSVALLREESSVVQHAQASEQVTDATYYLPLVFAARADCPATGVPNVTVQLSAQDDVSGVAEMLISNDGGFACAAWQPFVASQAWYVPPAIETTVFAKFRDHAGNVSAAVHDTVTLPLP